MFCKSCGRALFDSGEERFCCPYCGAEVVADSVDSNGTRQEVGKSAECDCGDWHRRANRREYWLKTLLVLAVYYVFVFLLVKALVGMELNGLGKALAIGVVAFAFAVGLYWLCDAVCRRLHDIGLSGWWIVLYVIINVVVSNVVRNCPGASALGDIWEVVGDAAPIVIGLWPGMKKKNEYGSVPPKKSFLLWPWGKSTEATDSRQDAAERNLEEEAEVEFAKTDDGKVVLRDGVYVHEAEAICRELERANIPFELCQVSKEGAGIVESHKNNWATALCIVSNYFNQGGLGVYLRILVHPEDVDRANAALSPKDRKVAKSDPKKIVMWVVIAAAVFLFIYAFASRAFREQQMMYTERFEYQY